MCNSDCDKVCDEWSLAFTTLIKEAESPPQISRPPEPFEPDGVCEVCGEISPRLIDGVCGACWYEYDQKHFA